jgi:hypothetical protein
MKTIEFNNVPSIDLTWDTTKKNKIDINLKENDLKTRYVDVDWFDETSIRPIISVQLPVFKSIDEMYSKKSNSPLYLVSYDGIFFITDKIMLLNYGYINDAGNVKRFRMTFDKNLMGKKIQLVTFKSKQDSYECTGIYYNNKIYVYETDLHHNDEHIRLDSILNYNEKYKLIRNSIEECLLRPFNFDERGLKCLYTTYIDGKTHYFRKTKDTINFNDRFYLQMALHFLNRESNEKSFFVNEFNYNMLCGEQETDVYLIGENILLIKTSN